MLRTFIYSFIFISLLEICFAKDKFVSLNLCTDRLLLELAYDKQISSVSRMALDDNISLKPLPKNIGVNDKKIKQLIPFINDTIIINKTFSSSFYEYLKKLGFKVYGYNSPTSKSELITLINEFSQLTNNLNKSSRLISNINNIELNIESNINQNVKLSNKSALAFSENISVHNDDKSNMGQMLKLLRLKNSAKNIKLSNSSKINLEKLISIKTDLILQVKYSNDFSISKQKINHPAIEKITKKIPTITIPSKYTICFDHGIWLGARYITNEL